MSLLEMYDDVFVKGYEQKANILGLFVVFVSLISTFILVVIVAKILIELVVIHPTILLLYGLVWLPKFLPEHLIFKKDE